MHYVLEICIYICDHKQYYYINIYIIDKKLNLDNKINILLNL